MIFRVKRPVVLVIRKMSIARVILAKMTVSPTLSCDHLTCFSLGTLYPIAPRELATRGQTPRSIALLQGWNHNIWRKERHVFDVSQIETVQNRHPTAFHDAPRGPTSAALIRAPGLLG